MLTTLYHYLLNLLISAAEELGLYEKALQPNYIRLKWYCSCGKEFFTDYPESELAFVQHQQSIFIEAGYEVKVFAWRKRDGMVDLGSNLNMEVENEVEEEEGG